MKPCTLRHWRERHGLSQPKAARAINAPVDTYRQWEYGRNPIPAYLAPLLDLLDAQAEMPQDAPHLSGDDLKQWERRLAIPSRAYAAGMLHVPVDSYHKWLGGHNPVPGPICRMVSLITERPSVERRRNDPAVIDAAVGIILDSSEPVSSRKLVARLDGMGLVLGGRHRANRLAIALEKDGRVAGVPGKGWVPVDKAPPTGLRQAITDAAVGIIERDGPIPTRDILERLRERGLDVRGKSQSGQLSQLLCRDGRVVAHGREGWVTRQWAEQEAAQ